MKLVTRLVASAALAFAPLPAFAQDDAAPEQMSEEGMAEFTQMMGGLFQAEPLTAEQEARLPAASAVVGTMMPEGFYAEMMAKVMESTMAPIFGMFSGPTMVIQGKLGVSSETLEALTDEERAEIAKTLDPAYDQRSDAMMSVMTDMMSGMFSVMEQPMRDGLSRAYAVRFDDAQLADISSFFSTPTGQVYATESMALFSDPQVMSAMMSSLPMMMQGIGDMESEMKAAMEALPAERTFADLSDAERKRVAGLLGMTVAELEESAPSSAASDDWSDSEAAWEE